MKNLYSVTAFFLLAVGLPAAAQPVHSQTKSTILDHSHNSIGLAFGNSSTAHNLIVVHLTWDNQSIDVSSVTDTKSNTYHLVPGSTVNWGTGATSYRSALYYAYNISVSGAALSITANLNGFTNNLYEIYISEYSNVLTTSDPLDKTRTTASSGTTVSSGAVTTTATNELIYGVAIGASLTIGTGPGFTGRSNAQDNIVEDKSSSSVSSYSATFSGGGFWVASVATFKPLVTLPVNLVSFDARLLQNNQVQLDWATAGETNSDHFEVEHSRDGLDWVGIGRIEAAGNSGTMQNYSFVDAAPYSGLCYYRLKQVDIDGRAVISKTVTVHIDPQQAATFRIYPNPAASFLVVEGASQAVTIFSTAGQRMVVRIIPEGESKTTLDLTSLPKGAYFVKAGDRSLLFYRQ